MKYLLMTVALAAPAVDAQIYHCETPGGPVYSDSPCGEQAKVVTLEDESSGISGGPSKEVRDDLARKREDRAEAREAARKAAANRPPAPIVIQQPEPWYVYPFARPWYGYRPHPGPRPPHPWPKPPTEPAPEPEPAPGTGGSVLRPQGGGNG